ncbi:MAG: tRNA uridine-5-carboxymethylaminomethyl(34) synthesis enzyme MnmG [Clostridia bacterium]|jgi:tRNA uridine 5-carboxymethylaminomethyl modification enzyme|nr:tRNA uridine-5-carboxymethylaminomethyl(34) synthesis enzyme MnmG [Clostridia bacterium]
MSYNADKVDVIVIGAGHAGCEAALATARMGLKTIVFAVNLDSIAMMPCNPSIGGTSKGHLVREIDALGGEMGKNIDKTFIQSKMLNKSKGPAVHSLRAQADKDKYSKTMKKVLENQENLKIKQNEIVDFIVEDDQIKGVKTETDAVYYSDAVILATGTYLRAKCIVGEVETNSGPNGLKAANKLTDALVNLDIDMRRFKTGTPCRIDGNTIDYSKVEIQNGDDEIVPFSFENSEEDIAREQIPCWLTYTNKDTHQIINDNLHRSPLYGGVIEGVGPRYCPSIEDKVVRFSDKDRHQIFLEPEGEDTSEIYVQGMSSSLPEDVQIEFLRTVPGLENCEVMRVGYAIEYDCINPLELKPTLELKKVKGLFSAGQFNGSSGYEEAAAQGLVAGINAALSLKGEEQVVIDRSEGYIGVLIDDLITKGTNEPYRMMTSRAEYRLILRQDNAEFRLIELGHKAGLITDERYNRFLNDKETIEKEIERLTNTYVGTKENVQELLRREGSTELKSGIKLLELVKRPELDYFKIEEIDEERPELSKYVKEQVNIIIKYEGYIKKQVEQAEQFKKMENKLIPKEINYDDIKSLRLEAKQKLNDIKPYSIGQASRISGVSPADVSVLLIYLEQFNRNNNNKNTEN